MVDDFLNEEEFGDIVFIIKKGTVKITRVNDEGKEVINYEKEKYDSFDQIAA